ncbi:hypothetical protein Pryu01_02618 [Paraliobacillus ryukyuensis]|uniref:TetR family transcriptional regulator n=1 Tax=Paraliobacillus ryukyuensis TaxID=200904 RepID=A0A366EBL6_9BACI|nr:TetR/AcrR family transcriptional regulator [Paraliobacillus ryukyuensis]RBO99773.1 TetR family transcriptional regulator [Paraliobacillus ryukyuensis]
MVNKERQLRKQEKTKNEILDVARQIISKEGFKGLSIRKITNTLDYSPGVIYHYFKDKNEITEILIGEGYSRILEAVDSVKPNEAEPEKEMKEIFINYINAALNFPEYYKVVMLSDDSSILKKTALLEEGVASKNPAFKKLCENIERGISNDRYAAFDSELTAQVIWASTFGLVIRLLTEKNISQKQRNRLIDHHFNILFKGLLV